MEVYLDNAATTPLDPEVFDAMKPFYFENYGNPSSTHAHGRRAKTAIEMARKKVAELLHVTPAEIFFTSGGTEADNTFLVSSINTYNIKHVISSTIEHHAVLHTLEQLRDSGKIALSFVDLQEDGSIDYKHLETLLDKTPESLVSLMHGNNEIGNITDIEHISYLTKQAKALFHSDTVQTVGHYEHHLNELNINSISAAGHKFHGPKGTGIIYINKNTPIKPFIHGGAQERNLRAGTENVAGIVGFAKALEIAYRDMEAHSSHISGLKARMINKLNNTIPGVSYHGTSSDLDNSLYTVLNVCLPESAQNDMLLFTLDINGISASGGSACSSGASTGSHVLTNINADPNKGAIRFSFSKYNTEEEIDYTIEKLAEFYNEKE